MSKTFPLNLREVRTLGSSFNGLLPDGLSFLLLGALFIFTSSLVSSLFISFVLALLQSNLPVALGFSIGFSFLTGSISFAFPLTSAFCFSICLSFDVTIGAGFDFEVLVDGAGGTFPFRICTAINKVNRGRRGDSYLNVWCYNSAYNQTKFSTLLIILLSNDVGGRTDETCILGQIRLEIELLEEMDIPG
jgi:hypothetical protein